MITATSKADRRDIWRQTSSGPTLAFLMASIIPSFNSPNNTCNNNTLIAEKVLSTQRTSHILRRISTTIAESLRRFWNPWSRTRWKMKKFKTSYLKTRTEYSVWSYSLNDHTEYSVHGNMYEVIVIIWCSVHTCIFDTYFKLQASSTYYIILHKYNIWYDRW